MAENDQFFNPGESCCRLSCCGCLTARKKVWQILTDTFTIFAHVLPVVLECVFLRSNFQNVFLDKAWYYLSSASPYVRYPLTVLVDKDDVQITQDVNGTWNIFLDTTEMDCYRLPMVEDNFPLVYRESQEPNYVIRVFLVIFLVCRYLLFLVRGPLLVARKLPTPRWSEYGVFLFINVSSCILSLAFIATEVEDCISWWVMGVNGLRLYSWQPIHWVINFAFLLIFLCAIAVEQIVFKYTPSIDSEGQPTRRKPMYRRKVFWFAAAVVFGASAFIAAMLVVTLGMFKPWILSIWIGALLLALDVVFRQKMYGLPVPTYITQRQQRPYRARSLGEVRVAKIPSFSDPTGDSQVMEFKRSPVSHLFFPVSNADDWPAAGALGGHVEEDISGSGAHAEQEFSKQVSSVQASSVVGANVLGRQASAGADGPLRTVSKAHSTYGLEGLSGVCLVCVEEPSSVILQPCGHGVVCRTCMEKIVERERQRMRRNAVIGREVEILVLCPLCRTQVAEIFQMDGMAEVSAHHEQYYLARRIWALDAQGAPCEVRVEEQDVDFYRSQALLGLPSVMVPATAGREHERGQVNANGEVAYRPMEDIELASQSGCDVAHPEDERRSRNR